MTAIDVHNHVIPDEVIQLVQDDTAYGAAVVDLTWSGAHFPTFTIDASFFDPSAKLRWLDRERISAAVVSSPPSDMRYDLSTELAVTFSEAANEGMQRFCAHDPSRLAWLANLPMQSPDAAIDVYRRAAANGCRGAAIGTSVCGRRLDEADFEPFWAVAAELGLPVLFHPAWNEAHRALVPYYFQNVIGNPLETTVTVERLIAAGTLDAHPDVKLILVHAGGFIPFQLGRLAHAQTVRPELSHCTRAPWSYLEQLWFDTITHDPAALAYLVERVGTDRVVLGTDMPFDMGAVGSVGLIEATFASDEANRILCRNARQLFGLTNEFGA